MKVFRLLVLSSSFFCSSSFPPVSSSLQRLSLYLFLTVSDMPNSIDYSAEPKGVYNDNDNSSSGTAAHVAPISLLTSTILPPDSYTADGTYWADLPSGEMRSFINKQMNEETLRELKVVGAMAKKDPWAPVGVYMSRYAATGMVSFISLFPKLCFQRPNIFWVAGSLCGSFLPHAVEKASILT